MRHFFVNSCSGKARKNQARTFPQQNSLRGWCPLGIRRAAYHGKQIHFSDNEQHPRHGRGCRVLASVGKRISLINRRNPRRPEHKSPNGRRRAPSSHAAEKGIEKILRYAPGTTARSTILPDNARYIVDNFRYFRSLGFQDIAMMPGCPGEWTDASNAVFEQQFQDVADLVIDEMRNGRFVRLSGVDAYITSYVNGQERPTHMCGAGRGMALIDTVGNIWPCHRWNKARHTNWCMGSIYEEFSEEARMTLDVPNQTQHIKANCERSAANAVCNGACPAESLEDNLDTYKPSPNTCRQLRVWARLARYIHDTLRAEENPVFLRHYYPRQNGGGATGTGDDARKTTTDSPAA